MDGMVLTQHQARRFILRYQGLGQPLFASHGAIQAFIRRVGCIQFDPLNIVGRNHELVLQARFEGFSPKLLMEMMYEKRSLLDGWDKVMSIYCCDDWPYFSRYRNRAWEKFQARQTELGHVVESVREALRERGPLSSLDLDFNERIDWPWAPARAARAALETMYFGGELIVHHRIHTRKVYDFAVRHIADDILQTRDPNQTCEDYYMWHVLRRIGAFGLIWDRTGDAWLGIFQMKSRERQEAFKELSDRGLITGVKIEGINPLCYLRTQDMEMLLDTLRSDSCPRRAAILAPLDNMLWDRSFVEKVFGFAYRWEVYKPVAERDYGYYVLPVLLGDRFIARFEPGYDAKKKCLVIKNWWWEPDVALGMEELAELEICFIKFMTFLGAKDLKRDRLLYGRKDLQWMKNI